MTSASATGLAARRDEWYSARSLVRGRALAIARLARRLLARREGQLPALPHDAQKYLRRERAQTSLGQERLRIAARRML